MPEPIAQWNPIRDCWETTQQASLLSEHWDAYSETWPTSGMTRSGVAYELPTWEPPTDGSESSSLLPTPVATEGTKGTLQSSDEREAQGRQVYLSNAIGSLLPTPTSRDWKDNKIRREPHRPDDTDTLSRALADLI